jgi:hypothetical protein
MVFERWSREKRQRHFILTQGWPVAGLPWVRGKKDQCLSLSEVLVLFHQHHFTEEKSAF